MCLPVFKMWICELKIKTASLQFDWHMDCNITPSKGKYTLRILDSPYTWFVRDVSDICHQSKNKHQTFWLIKISPDTISYSVPERKITMNTSMTVSGPSSASKNRYLT